MTALFKRTIIKRLFSTIFVGIQDSEDDGDDVIIESEEELLDSG